MALTKAQIREILSKAGVEADHMADAVNAITDGHTASIEALREENASLKQQVKDAKKDSEELQSVKDQLQKLKDEAKAREGKDYDALKKQFDDYVAEVTAKETKQAKTKAVSEILKDLNVSEKGSALALKYLNLDTIELDEEGKVKDASAFRKSIKEDWGDYIVTEGTKGASTHNPPNGGGAKTTLTKRDIMRIKDATERQKAIMENRELFE